MIRTRETHLHIQIIGTPTMYGKELAAHLVDFVGRKTCHMGVVYNLSSSQSNVMTMLKENIYVIDTLLSILFFSFIFLFWTFVWSCSINNDSWSVHILILNNKSEKIQLSSLFFRYQFVLPS